MTSGTDPLRQATSVAGVMAALDQVGEDLPVSFPAGDLSTIWALPVEVSTAGDGVGLEVRSTAPWSLPPLPPATVVLRIDHDPFQSDSQEK